MFSFNKVTVKCQYHSFSCLYPIFLPDCQKRFINTILLLHTVDLAMSDISTNPFVKISSIWLVRYLESLVSVGSREMGISHLDV